MVAEHMSFGSTMVFEALNFLIHKFKIAQSSLSLVSLINTRLETSIETCELSPLVILVTKHNINELDVGACLTDYI